MASTQPYRTGTAFVIRELTGEKRTVTLRGRGLPFRPFTLSGSMRHEITWYPGSPEGVLQVMGATLEPTTVNGRWSDRFISLESDEDEVLEAINTQNIAGQAVRDPTDDDRAPISISTPGVGSLEAAVNNVREVVDIIDSIRRHGQIIEVVWGNQLRRGIMSKFTEKWQTNQDLEWEMSFVWTSQDVEELDNIEVETRNKYDLNQALDRADDSLSIITAKPFTAPPSELSRFGAIKAATKDVLDAAEEPFKNIARLITDVQSGILDVEDTAIQISRSVVGAVTSAKRIAGAWTFLEQRANDLALLLDTVEDAIALNEFEDAGERLASRKDTRDRRRGARRIAGDSARQKDAALKALRPELIRAFTAREGQDLRDVATEFYGTPDGWRGLRRYNNLSDSRLSAGQLVLVPRRPPQERC